jgi:NADH dehydrogenase
VTGATGFVGRHLLPRLDPSNYRRITCLTRSGQIPPELSLASGRWEFVTGSLLDADTYARALAGSDAVIHLAAATGKARPDEHFRVNAEGTRVLLDASRKAGVSRFLHVSSIAVTFPDTGHYPYARSKQLGEAAVSRSGLRYAIVRPTIILGEDAPAWGLLSKLARAPVTIIPGDGQVRIQPIYIDDLVDCLASILDDDRFRDETFELGGPEPIPIGTFLARAHALYHRREPRVVHLPLAPLLGLLGLLERPFSRLLPVSVGQFASFRYDGTIRPNPLFQRHAPRMKTIDEMLRLSIGHG